MLRMLRQGQRFLVWAIVIGIGVVFVFFIGVGEPLQFSDSEAAITAGEKIFTVRDVLRERRRQEEQLRQAVGDGFDAKAAGDQLDSMATNVLTQRAVMSQEALSLGFRVTDDEILAYVRSLPGLRDESGRFRGDQVRAHAEREFGSESAFLESLRTNLLVLKFYRLLQANASVSDAELRDSLRYRLDTVSLAYVDLPTDVPPSDFEADEEAITELLAADEARVRSRFEEKRSEYNVPEGVHVRHILIKVEQDAGAEAQTLGRERAEQIRSRILEGEDFEKLAIELSEGPSGPRGGDLGFVERGQMVTPFEDAAFALEPGVLSELVETRFGFHVLRVEEKRPASERSFEEVREELAAELLGAEVARVTAKEQAERISSKLADGAKLVDVALEEGLTVQRTGAISRNPTGFFPKLGVSPDLLTEAFTLTEEKPNTRRIHNLENRFVLLELVERSPADQESLDSQLDQERNRLSDIARAEAEQAWLTQRRKTLEAEGKLIYNLSLLRDAR